MNSLKSKEWIQDDQPRDKMLRYGATSLSDAELLAIIISKGTQNQTATDVATQLLKLSNGNLSELYKKSIRDIANIKGIGKAKAVSISAALEFGRRLHNYNENMECVTSSFQIFKIFQPLLINLPYEEFWIVLLSQDGKITSKHKTGQGGLATINVDIKLIARLAIEKFSSGVILIHNHPSQNAFPSDEDKILTAKIKSALNIFDIKVVDHLIITDNTYFSFTDEGIL